MVPVEVFALKHEGGDDGEDGEGDNLLNHLQLDEGVWTTITHETQFVGRHLQGVLEEGDAPREDDHQPQGPTVRDIHLLQLQVAVPSQRHEDIAAYQEQYRIKSVHHKCSILGAKVEVLNEK